MVIESVNNIENSFLLEFSRDKYGHYVTSLLQ